MKLQDVVIVFGYNNTRIYDIEKIKLLCWERFKAVILLCKDDINDQDRLITDYTLQVVLEKHLEEKIKDALVVID
ncbi:hypothetical protein, partial [Fangia hongkongensis]